MNIDSSKIAAEAFFLYAETYLPDNAKLEATLDALSLCAIGTARATPSVATYVFRPSALTTVTGQSLFPGCVALESTELYLTHEGFRSHLDTSEFRTGLRRLYQDIGRLGVRIFWIGARPPADMLRNIHRSDPQARPVGAVTRKLFDAETYKGAQPDEMVIASLQCALKPGTGARASELVDAFDKALSTVSLVAFYHPFAPDLLRLFAVLPLRGDQPPESLAAHLAAFAEVAAEPLLGAVQGPRERPELCSALQAALQGAGTWKVSCDRYAGYISHPSVSTAPPPPAATGG